MGNATAYLSGVSNLVGLDKFITQDLTLKSVRPLGFLRPKHDFLVVVHHYMLTQNNISAEYKDIGIGISKVIAAGSNSRFTYYSQTNPFDIPIDDEGQRLPCAEETNYVFIIGFYGPDCVCEQVELLSQLAYKPVQIRALIAGKVAAADISLVI